MTPSRQRPRVVLITPALAALKNGNWQTARRWSGFLARHAQVQVATVWDGAPADLMIALHARRSAASIHAFAAKGRSCVVVLTGTDLYRDIRFDKDAQASLEVARRLVVLQSAGVTMLDERLREKTEVIYQSAATLKPKAARRSSFDLLLVGHLRAEKDPMTALRALARLDDPRLRLLHVGDAKDDTIRAQFMLAAARDARVLTLGALSHTATRQLISRGRVLLLPSIMEGGANVIIEAVTSGTPVLASRISGSIGMLGDDYPGYFPVGDDAALAALIERCRDDTAFLYSLQAACIRRAYLFTPATESAAVRKLLTLI
jgi:putative glycosyltransferase (TIGR04348 family)